MNELNATILQIADTTKYLLKDQDERNQRLSEQKKKLQALLQQQQNVTATIDALKKSINKVDEIISDNQDFTKKEAAARKAAQKLIKKHNLTLDTDDVGAQVYFGEWEEDMVYLDSWQQVLEEAQFIVKNL